MVNKENMEKWLTALESGRFKQGRGQLRTVASVPDSTIKEPEYCCLGVACQVYLEETGKGKWIGSTFKTGPSDRPSSSSMYLTRDVRDWLGLETFDPYLESLSMEATSANDSKGLTFQQIAAAFRKDRLGEEVSHQSA